MLTADQLFARRHAWTGGGVPTKADKATSRFKELRRLFFREQLKMCGGLDLWACAGTSATERARIFWNQATLDAWATIRQKH